MKCLLIFAVAASLSLAACNTKSEHDGHDGHGQDTTETSANQKLYNEVMNVHDEVMPKMDDIHSLKMSIREKIERTPNLPKEERLKLDALYAKLDSANDGMMVWMREFRPLPDSVGEEKAKAYLEKEMIRVNEVRQKMLDAIEAARNE